MSREVSKRIPREVSLSIPGLLGLPRRFADRVSLPQLPALQQFVMHADAHRAIPGRYGLHADLLGSSSPPLASLALLGLTGRVPEQTVAFADVVHLQPGMDDLVVIGSQWLAATVAELESLAATLNAHFEGELQFELAGERLFVRAAMLDEISTVPLYDAHARGARAHIPSRDMAESGARHLYAVLNEIQMLLHEHPVNTEREQRGEMTLNGVWIWGEGALARTQRNPYPGRFLGNSAIFSGLAHVANVAGGEAENVPECLPAVFSENLFVELDVAAEALDRDDIVAWESALQWIEQDWLAPAIAALRAGRLDTVNLYPGDGRQYRLRRSGLWKFWRRLATARRPHLHHDS